jgi:hypothetical protein
MSLRYSNPSSPPLHVQPIPPCHITSLTPAQLLRTCHQVLHEAYPVLYTENNFILYIDNNVVSPKAIPLTLTSGSFRTLQRITKGIQLVRLFTADLQDILLSFPRLKIPGIEETCYGRSTFTDLWNVNQT